MARLLSTFILIGLVVAAVVLQWNWFFFLLIGGLSILGLIELLDMFDMRSQPQYLIWTLSLATAYLITTFYYCQSREVGRVYFAHRDIFFFTLHLIGLFCVSFFRPLQGKKTLDCILVSFFGFAYVIFLFTFVTRILYLPQASGVLSALYLLAVTKCTDMGAYAIGTLCGKHRLIAHISPGKTWEGLGGALLGAYVAGLTLFLGFRSHFAFLNWTHALILPFSLGIAAVLGDLAESVLKRCAEKKDSGRMLPGIGGALDLIDSLCFTAPLFYFYLNYVIGLTPKW